MINILEILVRSKDEIKDYNILEGALEGLYQIMFHLDFKSNEI